MQPRRPTPNPLHASPLQASAADARIARLLCEPSREEHHVIFAYPRPQLVRHQRTCLNGIWRLCYDDERRISSPPDFQTWPLQIDVPFALESTASGINDVGFHAACWYEREFECMPAQDRVILRFGVVDCAVQIWLNGPLAVMRKRGHTPFSCDIARMLNACRTQTVAVGVEDDPPARAAAPR